MNIAIVPRPKILHATGSTVNICSLKLSGKAPVAWKFLRQAWTELYQEPVPAGTMSLAWQCDPSLPVEGYRLRVAPEGVTINYAAAPGAFYGFTCLAKLAAVNDGRLDCGEIQATPEFVQRMVSDDLCRQIPKLKYLKSVIRRLAYLNYNVYWAYVLDALELHCAPELCQYKDVFTQAELKELVAYAKQWFVDVRPIYNMLGHMENAGALEKYQSLMLPVHAKCGVKFTETLDPRKPEVREFLLHIIDELIDTFGPGLFGAGGDEPLNLVPTFGKEKAAELYSQHFTWLHDELAKRGCRMMLYADFFTPVWGEYHVGAEFAARMPKDTLFCYWNYTPPKPADLLKELNKLIQLGFDVIISPATHIYSRILPDANLCHTNCRELIRQADGGAKGFLMSNWSCMPDDCPREMYWTGFAIGAEAAWNGTAMAPYDQVMTAFHEQFYGLNNVPLSAFAPFYDFNNYFQQAWINRMWTWFWTDPHNAFEPAWAEAAMKKTAELKRCADTLLMARSDRNTAAWAAFQFNVERAIWIADRLMTVPPQAFRSREDAFRVAPQLEQLADRVRAFHQRSKKLWFQTSRRSEWNHLDAAYLDLEEAFRSLARYARVWTRFADSRKLLQ